MPATPDRTSSAARERELVEATRAFLDCGPDYGGQFAEDHVAYMEKFDAAYARIEAAVGAYTDA